MIAELKLQWVLDNLEKQKEKGITRTQIAEAVGIKPQQLTNQLNSRKCVSDDLFDKLAAAFGVNHLDLSERRSVKQTIGNGSSNNTQVAGDNALQEKVKYLEGRVAELEKEKAEYWNLIVKLTNK